jgi:hypothetical protein
MPLAGIDRRKIAALLANVEHDSGPGARNRLRATLSTFFAFAIAEGLVENSPVTGTAMAHEVSRDRVLDDSELATVWRSLPAGDYGDLDDRFHETSGLGTGDSFGPTGSPRRPDMIRTKETLT